MSHLIGALLSALNWLGFSPMQNGLQEKSAYGFVKRFKRGIKRLLGRWERPEYDVHILFQNNQPRYKKITVGSHELAQSIFSNLEVFRDSGHFPTPVEVQQDNVIVDFVAGSHPETDAPGLLSKLVDFYVVVFGRRSRLLAMENSGVWEELEGNLRILSELQLLSAEDSARVREHAAVLAPADIWIGFDYCDPIIANLLICKSDQSICGIDVKNLRAHQPLGVGLAKARYRWFSDSDVNTLLVGLRRAGAPDIEPYFEFIQLFERVRRVAYKSQRDIRLARCRWPARAKMQRMVFDDLTVNSSA